MKRDIQKQFKEDQGIRALICLLHDRPQSVILEIEEQQSGRGYRGVCERKH